MAWMNTFESYGKGAKFLHWTLALLIIALVVIGFTMGSLQPESLQAQAYDLHKLLGMLVFLMGICFILWRLINPKPAFPETMPTWEIHAARVVHFLLYAALLLMPILGFVTSTAAGYPPHIGAWEVPSFGIPHDKPLAEFAGDLHKIMAWTLITLVSIHSLAALKHHFFEKDNILTRML